MRFIKVAVNAGSAGVCVLLDRSGHSTGWLSTWTNLSLVLWVVILAVAAMHELVQGRAELIRQARSSYPANRDAAVGQGSSISGGQSCLVEECGAGAGVTAEVPCAGVHADTATADERQIVMRLF